MTAKPKPQSTKTSARKARAKRTRETTKWLNHTISYHKRPYLVRCTQRYRLGEEPYFGSNYMVVVEKEGHILETSHVSDSNLKRLIGMVEAVTAMNDFFRHHAG